MKIIKGEDTVGLVLSNEEYKYIKWCLGNMPYTVMNDDIKELCRTLNLYTKMVDADGRSLT
jgi:hypothetical protein